jgi:Na+/H+ antiporter NhaD/arsenite permease-like protein
VALLGAVALLAAGRMPLDGAVAAIDIPTMALLLGLMIVSAQLRLGGVYSAIARRIAGAQAPADRLLLVLVGVSALLSALLANDVVCLAVAPVLVDGCRRRGLPPVPFLLALACGANVGSAATLIGNPQNMLIGQTLGLSFGGYLLKALPPTVLGSVAVWWIIRREVRGLNVAATERPPEGAESADPGRPLDVYQAAKGLIVLVGVVGAFLFTAWPREVVAMGAGGVLLLSRKLHSREMLGLVDWQLLVLFAGLFVVNDALAASGLLDRGIQALASAGIDVHRPGWLFAVAVVLSNLVSNVPAVMLLLPAADHPQAGVILALGSTLAGNMFIVASIANIIVIEQAARMGVPISWRRHAATGIPVTLVTLAIAAAWLLLLSVA